jgi:hypothetical protein
MNEQQAHGKHEAPELGAEPSTGRSAAPAMGWREEIRDAIAPRTVLLILGVLILQLGFIVSYVGAFHSPTPHRITLAVTGPAGAAASTAAALEALTGGPLSTRVVTTADDARELVRTGEISGALLIDTAGTQDTLLVATGGGISVSTALESILARAEGAQSRTVSVEDVVPLQAGDGRGLTAFYAVIGWIVGGYLAAALIGVAKGARPTNLRRASIRVAAMVPYALLSGIGGAVIICPVLHALDGHAVAVASVGALLVFASAVTTMAFQSVLGVLGIGVTVLVFVVLGNPSAGGAYQTQLLPGFWRAIGQGLPNGAGTTALRQIAYFDGRGAQAALLTIALYAIIGLAVTLVAGEHSRRRGGADPSGALGAAT